MKSDGFPQLSLKVIGVFTVWNASVTFVSFAFAVAMLATYLLVILGAGPRP